MRIGLIVMLLLCLGGIAAAEEGQTGKGEPQVTTATKEMTGEVSGISKNFIALVYGESKDAALEMTFAVDKDVKVERKKGVSEIGVGDTVSVTYDETTETIERENKKETRIKERVAKVITFVKPGPKEFQETGKPVSEEPERQGE
jgi:hypothetical protein